MEAISFKKILGQFKQIKFRMDKSEGILWLDLQPEGRPCFTTELLNEVIIAHQALLQNRGYFPIDDGVERAYYQVISAIPSKPYMLGGDLALFLECLRSGDRERLTKYAKLCIDCLYPTICNFHGSVTTISLVRGQALGGGFESALSSSVIIAERDAKLGMPEVLFNLFPGMGAYQLLSRRLSAAEAERMIMSGRMYEAEELHDMGIVDIIAEPGEGEAAVYDFVHRNQRRRNAQLAIQKVRHLSQPISYLELIRVCHIWVDTAMHLTERDLKVMERLVSAQYRMSSEDKPRVEALRAIA